MEESIQETMNKMFPDLMALTSAALERFRRNAGRSDTEI